MTKIMSLNKIKTQAPVSLATYKTTSVSFFATKIRATRDGLSFFDIKGSKKFLPWAIVKVSDLVGRQLDSEQEAKQGYITTNLGAVCHLNISIAA